MVLPQITLVSFGGFEKKFLAQIVAAVGIEVQSTVVLKEEYIDLNVFFDPARRQYNGDLLLKEVETMFPHEHKVIALFNVDLFIPILTYIFGQAMLNGRIAVVSAFRLDNQRYGLKADQKLFFNRVKKEIVHELGHTLGLIHCHSPKCVMRSSTYVEDIDQKNSSFCTNCQNQLQKPAFLL